MAAVPGPTGLTAADVAALVKGELVGPGAQRLTAVAALDRAGPGDLSFLAAGKYLPYLHACRAGAVLCTEEHRGEPGPATRIVVKDPHRALLSVVRVLFPEPPRPRGVDPTAQIGRGARIGADVYLGPHVVIGPDVVLGDRVVVLAGSAIGAASEVGDDATLHPGVVLYPRTRVGRRVTLHAGVVLGSDGFGYVQGPEGHEKVPHVGHCIVGDDVEIGANTVVDRGSVDDTVIGDGTKVDNLVHIAHNVRIGKRCLIMAHVGFAGSARLEDDVIIAGQAGVAGHVTVHARARIAGQAGVIGDVEAGATVSGFPARPHREVLRAQAALFRLAAIMDELEVLVEGGRKPGR